MICTMCVCCRAECVCKVEELRCEMESRLDSQRRHMVQRENILKNEVEELKVHTHTHTNKKTKNKVEGILIHPKILEADKHTCHSHQLRLFTLQFCASGQKPKENKMYSTTSPKYLLS